MNKQSLVLLERAFCAEMGLAAPPSSLRASGVDAAITKQGSGLLHTKSKVAKELVENGYLVLHEMDAGKKEIYGYALTHLGRMTYCMLCGEGSGD